MTKRIFKLSRLFKFTPYIIFSFGIVGFVFLILNDPSILSIPAFWLCLILIIPSTILSIYSIETKSITINDDEIAWDGFPKFTHGKSVKWKEIISINGVSLPHDKRLLSKTLAKRGGISIKKNGPLFPFFIIPCEFENADELVVLIEKKYRENHPSEPHS